MNTLGYIIVLAIVATLLWGAGSFVAMDINPANWPAIVRLLGIGLFGYLFVQATDLLMERLDG